MSRKFAKKKPKPAATRLAEALAGDRPKREAEPSIERDARLTMSSQELLQGKDFAQMTADEIARAKQAIARMRLPADDVTTRRWRPDARGPRIDPRLLALPNVVMLPHMGSATFEGRIATGDKVIQNIRTWADGHRPPDQVLEG